MLADYIAINMAKREVVASVIEGRNSATHSSKSNFLFSVFERSHRLEQKLFIAGGNRDVRGF